MSQSSLCRIAAIFFSVYLATAMLSYGQRIIWAEKDNNRIMEGTLTLTGITNQAPFITSANGPAGGLLGPSQITLDVSDERIFYTNNYGEDIIVASIYDGSSAAAVITTGAMVYFEDMVYSGSNTVFASMNTEVGGVYSIPDNNNDGGNEVSLNLGGYNNSHHLGITVSDSWGLLFIIDQDDDILYNTNLGGTFAAPMVTSISNLEWVVADDVNEILYFTRVNPLNSTNEIYSCDYYGSNVTLIANVGIGQMQTIQVLPQFNKIYFLLDQKIKQMTVDGTGVSTLADLTGTGISDFAIQPDYDPPIFTALSPADDDLLVDPAITQVSMTFSEAMKIYPYNVPAGQDEIRLTEDGTVVATIPRSSSNISISNNIVTITLPVSLSQVKDYDIQMGYGVFSDLSGNGFVGINLPTGWNFTTKCVSLTAGTAIGTQSVCSGGDPVNITGGTASGGDDTFSYQWESSTTSSTGGFTSIGGASSADYDPPAGLSVTTYYRRIVNSATCSPATGNPITVTVINPAVIAVTTGDQQSCDKDVVTFDITASGTTLTYQWQEDAGSGFNDIVDNTTYSGSTTSQLTVTTDVSLNGHRYQCVVKTGGSCSVSSTPARLTVNPLPVATDQNPSVCEDTSGSGTATFDLTSLEAAIIGAQSNVKVGWFTDAARTIPVTTPSNVIVSNGNVFYPEVKSLITGCKVGGKVVFTVNTRPAVLASPNPVTMCSGANSVVTLTGGGSYAWTVSSNPSITGATPGSGTTINLTLNNSAATQQQVDYTITPTSGTCTGTPLVLPVKVDPQPTVFNLTKGGSDCQGGGGVLFTLSGSQNGISYQLLKDGSQVGNAILQNGGAINFPPVSTNGLYKARAVTANNCSVDMNGSFTIQMIASPSGTGTIAGITGVCAGLTEDYQVNGISNATSYQWTIPTNIPIVSPTQTGQSISLSIEGTTGFSISVVGVNQCGTGGSAQLTLTMLPPPDVTITLPTDVYAEEEALFSYSSSVSDIQTANSNWNFGDGETASGQDVRHIYATGGSYDVSVEVRNGMGCVGTDVQSLVVKPKAALSDLSIKNVVTANGDTKNAYLYIENINKFPGNEVILLDRWGVEVFHTRDYNNDWDLTKNGDYLPAGNYVCVVRLDETGAVYKRAITVVKGQQ